MDSQQLRKTEIKFVWPILALLIIFSGLGLANAQEPLVPDTADDIEETQYIGGEKEEIEAAKKVTPVATDPSMLPITIKADKITNEGNSGISRAFGKVFIQKGTKSVWGNSATYNQRSGEATIEGDVHYIDESEGVEIFCEKADLDFNGDTGVLYNARLNSNNEYFINGKTIVKKGKGQYIVADGGVTSCPQDKPHWKLDASEVDLTLDGYAHMKHLIFRVGSVPILYLPYWIAPAKTKRATGFLAPVIGNSSTNGVQISNSFFWAIAENADLTILHKHMGDKGNLFGSELRYILGEGIYGNMYAEFLKESDPEKETDREMWKLKFDHNQALPMDVKGVVHLDLESEDSIDREYGNDVKSRTRRYTDSYMTLNKSWTNRVLTLLGRQQISTLPDREDEVSQLPSIIFTNQQEQLWESPFYAGLESSYTSFRTDAVRNDDNFSYDVDRLDFRPKVAIPMAFAPWFSVTPELGYRYTTYSNGVDNETGENLNESFAREYYTASLEISGPKFYKIFENDSEERPKTKHLITPSIKWNFLPDYSFDGEDRKKVKVLDGIDSESPTNTIEFSLRNQVFVKEVLDEESSQTIDVVSFNIVQGYDLNEADRDENPEVERKPLKPLVFDLDTRVVPWLLLNYYTTYNHYDNRFDSSNLELGFTYNEIFSLSLERNYRWGGEAEGAKDSIWDSLYVDANFGNGFSTDYSIIYDEFNSEINNHVLRLQYTDDCWSTTISWFDRKINVNNGAGQETVEQETGFLFSINLLGVGDVFGGKKEPLFGKKI